MAENFVQRTLDTLLEVVEVEFKIPLGFAEIKLPVTDHVKKWWEDKKSRLEVEEAIRRAEEKFIAANPADRLAQILHDFPLYAEEDYRVVVFELLTHLEEEKITWLAEAKLEHEWDKLITREEIHHALELYLPFLLHELNGIKEFRDIITARMLERIDEKAERIDQKTEKIDKTTERIEDKLNQVLKVQEIRKGKDVPKNSRKTKVKPPKITKKKQTGSYNTINTEYAIDDFCEMLKHDSPKRVMHIWGDAMMGKTHLSRDVFPAIAKNAHKNIIHSRIEFGGSEDEIDLMCSVLASFPNPEIVCPSFTQQHNSFKAYVENIGKTTISQNNFLDLKQLYSVYRNEMIVALIDDLRRHEEINFVFIFDAVNNIPSVFRDWLLNKFVFYMSQLKNVRIVITSKEQVDLTCVHSHLCILHPLRPIKKIKPYVEYCQRHEMHMKTHEIRTIVTLAGHNPGQFLIWANEYKKNKDGLRP